MGTSRLSDQVRAFHEATGAPIGKIPRTPADARVRLRLRLIAEEFLELLGASLGGGEWLEIINLRLQGAIGTFGIQVNLPEFIDALADLDYVIEGARLEFGADGGPIADLVHAANMTKASGEVRPDGKRLKPPGFVPPDIAGELRRQGWGLDGNRD